MNEIIMFLSQVFIAATSTVAIVFIVWAIVKRS